MLVRSSAKLNFTLDIVSRREDGYHELDSLVHTVALWDKLQLQFDVPWRFSCNIPQMENSSNLCVRAAKSWFEAARENGAAFLDNSPGMSIHLEKFIPSGAGLGGGSGNAAAILLALRAHYDAEKRWVNDAQLLQIGAALGADVPLFLRGGAVRMQGIGEKLTALEAMQGWTVIVRGPLGVSTPQAYRAWDDANESAQNHAQSPTTTARLLQIWNTSGDSSIAASTCSRVETVARLLSNDLRAAAKELKIPVEEAREALLAAGAAGAEMTGSGSAVFGLFTSQQSAQHAVQELKHPRHARFEWRVWAAPLCESAVEFAISESGSETNTL